MKPVLFLGGGRITGALVSGLRLSGYDRPVIVHDRHPEKLRQLRRQYGVAVEPNLSRAIRQAGMLVVAVRPDSVSEVLQKVGTTKGSGPVIALSLAAGIPLAKLRASLGRPVRWARAMPSPAGRSGRGLTALAFERGFPVAARRQIRELFGRVGTVVEIPENRFDAFTVTYSSSHGYHAVIALSVAAIKLGLDRKSALLAAAHAYADGILAWRDGHDSDSLKSLLHEAATPGGIAAAVMSSMDSARYGRIIELGLRAGIARMQENRK